MTSTVRRLCVAAAMVGLALLRLDGSVDAASATQAAPPKTGTAAISGVVTDAASKQPIAGAVVWIQGGPISVRVVTDSRGRFVFRDLPEAAGYTIRPTKAGYQSAGPQRELAFGRNVRIPLADGEWVADLNLPMTRLGAISGMVVDERGEPVVGIPVRALVKLPVAGVDQLAAGPVTKTDDRGVYRIAGLGRGRYLITVPSVLSSVPADTSVETLAGSTANALAVTAPGARTVPNGDGIEVEGVRLVIGNYPTPPPIGATARVYPVMFHPAVRSSAEALTISLADGEEKRGVDVALHLETAVRVSGRVTGPAEATAGLVVRLLPAGGQGLGVGSEQATSLTDTSGRFTFPGVPAGSYILDARTSVSELAVRGPIGLALPPTPGFVSENSNFSSIDSAPVSASFTQRIALGKGLYAGQDALTVGGTDIDDATLTLRAGATINGRFIYDGTAKPGPLITAKMDPADGHAEFGSPYVRLSGSTSGMPFAVGGLLGTKYFLRATAGTGLTVKSIVAGGRDYTDEPFDMSSGTDITDVVVTFTDKGSSLAGTVRAPRGLAMREAAVIIFPTDKSQWSRFGLDPHRIRATAVVDQRGFTLPRLPAGDYHVVAVDLAQIDAWHDPRFFAAAAPLATRVSLAWGTTTTQDLVLVDVVIK